METQLNSPSHIVETLAEDPMAYKFLPRYQKPCVQAAQSDGSVDQPSPTDQLSEASCHSLQKDDVTTVIDERDKDSPDNWVSRSPDLLRLTGKHPLNSEPNITKMFDEGFITPVSMHFVRNHGKVPRIERNEHRLTIGGLVQNELVLTMDDLLSFPRFEIPITVCCSGQRRKELNAIKKSIGFNWSTSAHSCNIWTGVRLSDVLSRANVDMNRAKHVLLDGAKKEGLPKGQYGTSIDILTAMNPHSHVILAWEQNGRPLHPDHGYPLRIIVPGTVGGRAVKWLERIWISEHSSENFYHFHDNRVIPSHVDTKLATEEGWWYREEYLYNELNVNSVTVHPEHNESFSVSEDGDYIVEGFGTSGGGRRVTRVEVSLDNGQTWTQSELDYPEERYSATPRLGKYYCWMFWKIRVPKSELVELARNNRDIRSRAFDTSNNSQPLETSWNLLGMGNNSQYRVKAEIVNEDGGEMVKFIHPIAEGANTSGWMSKATGESQTSSRKRKLSDVKTPTFTLKEVGEHNSDDSAWLIIDRGVYDCTKYLEDHPGGVHSILMNSGMDATEDFYAIHSKTAIELLEKFYIGELADGEKVAKISPSGLVGGAGESGCISPNHWTSFQMIKRIEVNHDTRLYTFRLPRDDGTLGVPVGQHMFVEGFHEGKKVVRAFTPVSTDDEQGTFELCVKTYFAKIHPDFPDGGKLTVYLEGLKVGDSIRVKGPYGQVVYKGKGKVSVKGVERNVRRMGMLCGGSGITPAFQIMQKIYGDSDDTVEFSLLYANRKEEDILMRERIELMQSESENMKVALTLSEPPADWRMGRGRMDLQKIRAAMPPPADDCLVGICGPPAMISEVCLPALEALGYEKKNIVVF